jgi:hypothetical protein
MFIVAVMKITKGLWKWEIERVGDPAEVTGARLAFCKPRRLAALTW